MAVENRAIHAHTCMHELLERSVLFFSPSMTTIPPGRTIPFEKKTNNSLASTSTGRVFVS